jgi:hypothetical protein
MGMLYLKIKLSIITYKVVKELMAIIKIRKNKILLKKMLQINLFTNLFFPTYAQVHLQ